MSVLHPPVLRPSLPRWDEAYRKARAGIADTAICIIGNSTDMGCQANTSANSGFGADGFNSGWHAVLATLIPGASNKNFCGDHSLNAVFSGATLASIAGQHDNRLTVGSSWVATVVSTFGGRMWTSQSPNTDELTFTLPGVDTFEVWYQRVSANGEMSVQIDSETPTIVATGGVPSAYVSATFTAGSGVGTHTIKIRRTGGGANPSGPVNIGMIRGYVAGQREVQIYSGGMSSQLIAQANIVASAWDYGRALRAYNPSLTIVKMDINDWAGSGTAPATYESTKRSVIANASLAGDVLLIGDFPSATTVSSIAQQETYLAINRKLAAEFGIPYYAFTDLWGSHAAVSATYYRDTKHPNATGYLAAAQFVRSLLVT